MNRDYHARDFKNDLSFSDRVHDNISVGLIPHFIVLAVIFIVISVHVYKGPIKRWFQDTLSCSDCR